MTRSQKVVLVGFALIVMLFALITWHGTAQPACAERAARIEPQCKPGSFIKALSGLASWLSTGVKLPKQSYAVAVNARVDVAIPAASDKLRSLRVKLTQGSAAQLSLVNVRPDEDSDPDGMAKQRDESRNKLPYANEDGALQITMTFVVTDKGGRLTMHCTGSSPCVFEGE